MKKLLIKLAITLVFLYNISCSILGQDKTNFAVSRSILLDGESEKQEIILPVSEKNGSFNLTVSSKIYQGELTIEVYDPKGEKQGNYTVGCQLYTTIQKNNNGQEEKSSGKTWTNKEIVNGRIDRKIINPIVGNWIVKIIPNRPKGSLKSEYVQQWDH